MPDGTSPDAPPPITTDAHAASTARVSLITGASRGIGAATAHALAQRGDHVVIHYRHQQSAAEEVAASIKKVGGTASILQADLTIPAEVETLFTTIRQTLGGLDALVCNAGITHDKPIVRMSEEEFSDVIATNLTGTWRCIRHAVRLMRGRENASVVVTGSSGAIYGNPGQSNYAASKGGILAMMRSLARELGPWQIRVNAVVPGFTQTDMTTALSDDHLTRIVQETPLGRLATPADIAGAAVFFTSPEAAFITGQILIVDGGRI